MSSFSNQAENIESDILESDPDEPDVSDLIRSEFIRIIQDFKQYLAAQKNCGNTAFSISNDSKKKMNSWGTNSAADCPFVFKGSENARIFIIDSHGDHGRFFDSEAGRLLVKILNAMYLTPQKVFICNAANPEQIENKIKVISPKVIITLGQNAAQILLGTDKPLEQLRGRFHDFAGIKVMPTFHPLLLIKQAQFKRQVWEDLKQVMAYAGLKK